jgi:glycosyltransferase involved in cell wall biosynthesis
MHLCLIIYGSLDTLTGGYIYDKRLVEHLRHHGHTVDIVSLPWRYYSRHLLDNFSAKLKFDLGQTHYDLILQDELNHPSLFWLNRKVREQNKSPIVSIVHQLLCSQPRVRVWNAAYRVIERHYLKSVDALIFNSTTTHQNVRRLLKFDCPSIIANPAGDRLGYLPASEHIKIRAYQSDHLRLLTVGNLTPNKGVYPLIEALSSLSEEIWHLTVVGSLSMHKKYVRKIKRLISARGLKKQVDLVGAKDGDELIKILSQSHVFVMPFSYEGFGMAYLEAMAFGLPTIGSTQGAVKEFVQHEHNGLLIAPNDAETLTRVISDLYRNRDLLAKLGGAALQLARGRRGWSSTMESIHSFLTNLVNRWHSQGLPS